MHQPLETHAFQVFVIIGNNVGLFRTCHHFLFRTTQRAILKRQINNITRIQIWLDNIELVVKRQVCGNRHI